MELSEPLTALMTPFSEAIGSLVQWPGFWTNGSTIGSRAPRELTLPRINDSIVHMQAPDRRIISQLLMSRAKEYGYIKLRLCIVCIITCNN